jgi:hypothetical protein
VAQHRGAPLVSLDSRLVDLTGQGAPLTG